jgi:hypothetical protein
MTASSYRLDTVAAHLVERLEGARPSYQDRPDDAVAAFARIADLELDRIVAEHDEIIGEQGVGDLLRREIHETFLPRYLRLAHDQNLLEVAGYRAWRGGDPIARAVTTVMSLLVALTVVRVVHHPVMMLAFVAVALVPFLPELRRWYYRRQYARFLQEAVDDMGRIQDRMDVYGPAPDADPVPESGRDATPAARASQAARTPDKEPPS